jgi:hypothetical protein
MKAECRTSRYYEESNIEYQQNDKRKWAATSHPTYNEVYSET